MVLQVFSSGRSSIDYRTLLESGSGDLRALKIFVEILQAREKRVSPFFENSDVWGEIFSYLPSKDAEKIKFVCHILNDRDFDWKSGELKEYVTRYGFGAKKWEHYFGQVEKISLPLKLLNILKSPCPFSPEQEVKDTHILFYLPQAVNGDPLTLNSFEKLVKKPRADSNGIPNWRPYTDVFNEIKSKYGNQTTDDPCWILMTKDPIPDSIGKSFKGQCEMIPCGKGLELPKVLELVIGILLRYTASEIESFSHSPNSVPIYMSCFCEEKVVARFKDLARVSVNRRGRPFSPSSLEIRYDLYSDNASYAYRGLMVVRRFSGT